MSPKTRKVGLLLIVSSLGILAAFLYMKSIGPVLYIEQDMYEIGAISPGQNVESKVTIQNKGQRVLVIKGIGSSCNCTVPSISSSAIPPKGKAVLRVMMSGIFRPGEIQEQVTILSNDPRNKIRTVSFRGLVDPVLQTIPVGLNFDLTSKESLPIQRKVAVEATRGHHVPANLGAITDSDFVRAYISHVDTATDTAELEVELLQNAPVGPLRATVKFTEGTNLIGVPFEITGKVVGNLRVEPESFYFGNIPKGATRTLDGLLLLKAGAGKGEDWTIEVFPLSATNYMSAKVVHPLKIEVTVGRNAPLAACRS